MLTAAMFKHGFRYILDMVWTALYLIRHFLIVFFVHWLVWHHSFFLNRP